MRAKVRIDNVKDNMKEKMDKYNRYENNDGRENSFQHKFNEKLGQSRKYMET